MNIYKRGNIIRHSAGFVSVALTNSPTSYYSDFKVIDLEDNYYGSYWELKDKDDQLVTDIFSSEFIKSRKKK